MLHGVYTECRLPHAGGAVYMAGYTECTLYSKFVLPPPLSSLTPSGRPSRYVVIIVWLVNKGVVFNSYYWQNFNLGKGGGHIICVESLGLKKLALVNEVIFYFHLLHIYFVDTI